MRIAWITDLHIGTLDASELEPYIYELRRCRPDLVVSAGDLVDGYPFADWLAALQREIDCPVYFVLGNHECYGTSIAAARRQACGLNKDFPGLHYLPAEGIIPLTSAACLLGHDSWADGESGDYLSSSVVVQDVLAVEEFVGLEPEERLEKLRQLGREAADYFEEHLPVAVANHHEVIIVTHVPPFREACFHQGCQADDNWSPHFVCHSVGETLKKFAQQRPNCDLTVLCGHAHHAADIQILPNLRCITGFEGPFLLEVRGALAPQSS